jgi:hypothetical protein
LPRSHLSDPIGIASILLPDSIELKREKKTRGAITDQPDWPDRRGGLPSSELLALESCTPGRPVPLVGRSSQRLFGRAPALDRSDPIQSIKKKRQRPRALIAACSRDRGNRRWFQLPRSFLAGRPSSFPASLDRSLVSRTTPDTLCGLAPRSLFCLSLIASFAGLDNLCDTAPYQ